MATRAFFAELFIKPKMTYLHVKVLIDINNVRNTNNYFGGLQWYVVKMFTCADHLHILIFKKLNTYNLHNWKCIFKIFIRILFSSGNFSTAFRKLWELGWHVDLIQRYPMMLSSHFSGKNSFNWSLFCLYALS